MLKETTRFLQLLEVNRFVRSRSGEAVRSSERSRHVYVTFLIYSIINILWHYFIWQFASAVHSDRFAGRQAARRSVRRYSDLPFWVPSILSDSFPCLTVVSHAELTDWVAGWLTQWSRLLSERLAGPQVVEKFPAFYGTLVFITAFTRARHLSLSWARSMQFMHPSRFFKILFNIILPPTPESSK